MGSTDFICIPKFERLVDWLSCHNNKSCIPTSENKLFSELGLRKMEDLVSVPLKSGTSNSNIMIQVHLKF